MIDLHTHTNSSDGELSPKQLIKESISRGVKVIAITDHDSINGIEEAISYSKGKNITVIPGVEITCDESKFGFRGIHVLGLFIDYKSKHMVDFVKNLQGKEITIKKAIDIIKKSKGIPFLAHPGVYNDHDAEELINIFLKGKGYGLETYYPYHVNCIDINKEESDRKNKLFREIASEKNLLETGGSDFHGKQRDFLGKESLPINIFNRLNQTQQHKNT